MKIEKESMFKIVKFFSSGVTSMYKDDYFAMAKRVKDCEFNIDDEKAVLKFKGVEIYPEDEDFEGEFEQENSWETIATLDLKGYIDDYDGTIRYKLTVAEPYGNNIFEPSKNLLVKCGVKF